MKWNRWLILGIALALIVIPSVYSEYWDYLTIGQADNRYCKIGEACSGAAGGANLTGSGSAGNIAVWDNATHLTYTADSYVTDTRYQTNNDSVTSYIQDQALVNTTDLDELCNTDGKILKRIAGTWVCADDDTGSVTGSIMNYTKIVSADKEHITLEISI